MPRFKNSVTGVVVNVDDAKADRFRDGWESVKGTSSGGISSPKPAKKTAAKSDKK